jgi:indolepyruvate ferredoxin oxidoreductase beta subunit
VNTHIRWDAEQVYSPLVGAGEADVLLAFEWAEALRYLDYLRPGGVAVVNQHTIEPITVTSGGAHYPTEEELRVAYGPVTDRLYVVPGTAIAQELGNARAANVVLLGALSTFLEVPVETWLQVVEARVPPRFVELNRQAFLRGRQAITG